MSEPVPREEAVFNAALKLPAAERAAYLEQTCAGDNELRARVEDLLKAIGQPLDGTVRVSFPLTEKPGDKIGRYKLLEQIGEGGFGIVYIAEQEVPVRRRVALKVIKMGMDTKEVIARFEAERQALAMMDHPNIAKVLDAGATDSGRPYFVMELVKGERVTDYCDKNNLTTRQRLDLFVQICQAIQHAHQKGIIHRDIKPSNILVTMHDGKPVPKVIDFGIAKATEQRLTDKTVYTALEQMIGTPAYMSPEQAERSGIDIDTRSDIYSLGVLLYELLTGKTPFDGHELVQAGLDGMRRMIREKEPQRPSTKLTTMVEGELTATAKRRQTDAPKLIHSVRGDLDWIVMKCLEKDRTRRYETANGLAADLSRHVNNEPVIARPPSTGYRLQKMLRRNKLAFVSAALIALAIVLVTFIYVQAIRMEERKTRMALEEAQTNFKLARRAVQDMYADRDFFGQTGKSTDEPQKTLEIFLEMYRKARASQPGDRELMSEYIKLLQARSKPYWDGTNQAFPAEAVTNLDEAITLLQATETRSQLTDDERYLLTKLYQDRVSIWRWKESGGKQQTIATMPDEIKNINDRAVTMTEQLVNEKPGDLNYAALWMNAICAGNYALIQDTNALHLSKDLAILEKILEKAPNNQQAILCAADAQLALAKTATNSDEACQRGRNLLNLHSQYLRAAKGQYGYYTSGPQVNPLSICSMLLRDSKTANDDYATMTNLLAAAIEAHRPGANFFMNGLDDSLLDHWSNDHGASELVLALPIKIACLLQAQRRDEEQVSFVNHYFAADPWRGESRRFNQMADVRDQAAIYLNVAAGVAEVNLNRPNDARTRLEPFVVNDTIRSLRHSAIVTPRGQPSTPKVHSELFLDCLAGAVFDEACALSGHRDQADQKLDELLAGFEANNYNAYASSTVIANAFTLCRRATADGAQSSTDAQNKARVEFANAIKRVATSDLTSLARLLSIAAGNSQAGKRRELFAEEAMTALKQITDLKAYRSESFSTDVDWRSLRDLAEFRQMTVSLDQAWKTKNKGLANGQAVDLSDSSTLEQAAATKIPVRLSGQIANTQTNGDFIFLHFVGMSNTMTAYLPIDTYRTLSALATNHAGLIGGTLVFTGEIQQSEGPEPEKFSVIINQNDQIKSFHQYTNAAASSEIIRRVEDITSNDLGMRIKAQGKVASVGPWRGDMTAVGVLFKGTRWPKGFTAILPLSQKFAFNRRFGGESNNIVGQTIRFPGVVEIADFGAPQMWLGDVREIEVLEASAAPKPRPQALKASAPRVKASEIKGAIGATDIATLTNHLGARVSVIGLVQKTSLTAAQNAANIELEGPRDKSLLVWVSKLVYPQLIETFGDDWDTTLSGQKIRVSGMLENYGGRKADWAGRFQVTLDNVTNLALVADEADAASAKTPK